MCIGGHVLQAHIRLNKGGRGYTYVYACIYVITSISIYVPRYRCLWVDRLCRCSTPGYRGGGRGYTDLCISIYISIYLSIYVYKYIYIDIHIYKNIHIHVYIYIHIHKYIRINICIYIYIYMHICLYMFIHTDEQKGGDCLRNTTTHSALP